MYTINSTTIENDTLIANVTIHLDAKTDLEVNVPVLYPKSKEEMINAIIQREANEQKKFDSAPILTAIKAEMDGTVVGKKSDGKTVVM
jgi:flagella basal body P-ring formation protein FlgA